ncbi:MAG: hypothetical protein H7039_18830 [Bryobacteraceae bacterium]|nr:hypothetical protein [Bryobacteraceae bacterium]
MKITRREFAAIPVAFRPTPARAPLVLPVNHVIDSHARWMGEQLPYFWSRIWPEVVRDLGRCGIGLQTKVCKGEIRRSPSGNPLLLGLEPGVINLFVTNYIPLAWDNGRALAGVTARHRGYHLCMIALNHAHVHQIPFLSINTCLHELLHALFQDILESRKKARFAESREYRIDLYATRLWLFHDGAEIRRSAELYLKRLQADVKPR